jgi:hypothetical protein
MDKSTPSSPLSVPPETLTFYRRTMTVLRENDVPFLVGGAYAYAVYTGIVRHTKDFDLFLREEDVDRAIESLRGAGYKVDKAFAHWLAKAYEGDDAVDLIYRSGNGICIVDDAWFERAVPSQVLDMDAHLCSPEEIIWSKAFIMERERFDGADVIHILLKSADRIDWDYLVERFGPHWRILLTHLVLFGFVYPSRRSLIPEEIMAALIGRLKEEVETTAPTDPVCYGTLLSRAQYLTDVEEEGFTDARLLPPSNLTARELVGWTEAIKVDGPEADRES